MTAAPLILASASPTRAAMLRDAGVEIETRPARVDEAAVKDALAAEGAPPRDVADALAELKATRVSLKAPDRLVLGADQVLEFDGRVHDKPRDRADAREQLRAFAGKAHRLLSAAVAMRDGEPLWRHVGVARLHVRPFTDAFLDAYLDRMGEDVTRTVGGYRLEGLGAQLFARVEGDHFTVLGVGLLELLGWLRAEGTLIE